MLAEEKSRTITLCLARCSIFPTRQYPAMIPEEQLAIQHSALHCSGVILHVGHPQVSAWLRWLAVEVTLWLAVRLWHKRLFMFEMRLPLVIAIEQPIGFRQANVLVHRLNDGRT